MRSAERMTSSGRNTSTGVFLARIWRLIEDWMRRRCSSSTSRMSASDSSPPSESKYTTARLSSLSTSMFVTVTKASRSSSMRTSSSAMTSRSVSLRRAERG